VIVVAVALERISAAARERRLARSARVTSA
jgi:hypothetical protein